MDGRFNKSKASQPLNDEKTQCVSQGSREKKEWRWFHEFISPPPKNNKGFNMEFHEYEWTQFTVKISHN